MRFAARVPVIVVLTLAFAMCAAAHAQVAPAIVLGSEADVLIIHGAAGARWVENDETILALDNPVVIEQGRLRLQAPSAVVWLGRDDKGGTMLDVYIAGVARLSGAERTAPLPQPAYVRFVSRRGLLLDVPGLAALPAPPADNALYLKARDCRLGRKAPPGEEELPFAVGDVRPEADAWRFVQEGNVMRGELRGNVSVVMAQGAIVADTVLFWVEKYEENGVAKQRLRDLYAEGSVTFRGPTQVIHAERLYLTAATNRAVAFDVRMEAWSGKNAVPVVFAAPRVYQLGPQLITAPTGYLSTCDFADPHYRITGRDFNLVEGRPLFSLPGSKRAVSETPKQSWWQSPLDADARYVQVTDAVFRAGSAPFFYVPYLSHELEGGFLIAEVAFGNTSEFGAFVRTKWRLNDLAVFRTDWSSLGGDIDYYQRRGIGYGATFSYGVPSRFGFLQGYTINDQADEDDAGTAIEGHDRGRILWRHREFLPDRWRADLEFSWLSDANFLPVYFKTEAEEAKPPETVAYLRKIIENRMYTVTCQPRVNDFETVVERTPQLGIDWIGEPLLGDNLVWTDRSQLGRLQLVAGKDSTTKSSERILRLDTTNELSAPRSYGPIQFEPFVTGELTGHSNDANDEGGTARAMTGYGFRSGTTIYRTFDAHSDFLQVDRLRHVLSPTVSYFERWYRSKPAADLVQFDEIDARDYSHTLVFGLHNRLQTKRGIANAMHNVDFLVLDVDYHLFPGDRGENAGQDDYISSDLIWRIRNDLSLTSENNRYNVAKERMEEMNGRLEWSGLPGFRIAYRHQYVWVNHTAGPDRSIGTVEIRYEPVGSRYIIELSESYDFNRVAASDEEKNPKQMGTRLALSRRLHQWILTFTAEFFMGTGRDETRFGVLLQPPMGLGAGNNPVSL